MAGPQWSTDVKIRFGHCDPARIVYFATHFDILNGVIEDWFTDALGLPYPDLIANRRVGLGYAHASCDFRVPARLGDIITYAVGVERIGGKSLALVVTGRLGHAEVLTARLVIVSTDLDQGTSIPLPEDIRAAVTAYRDRTV